LFAEDVDPGGANINLGVPFCTPACSPDTIEYSSIVPEKIEDPDEILIPLLNIALPSKRDVPRTPRLLSTATDGKNTVSLVDIYLVCSLVIGTYVSFYA